MRQELLTDNELLSRIQNLYHQIWEMEKKILKAVLEDELVDGVEIKKWEKHEFESSMADYLLNAYGNRRELCSSEEKEEKEEKAEKKVSKKK